MKQIVKFKMDETIPDEAKFLYTDEEFTVVGKRTEIREKLFGPCIERTVPIYKYVRFFYYEIPVVQK